MTKKLRIGTRDSQLALWQSTLVQDLLAQKGISSELVHIKSEGDINLITPLYEMGVQGIFTKTLDIALLNNTIDIAVHSMKDVPVVLARGIQQAAVLERASYIDLLVFKHDLNFLEAGFKAVVASSSIRRIAQWLHRYPEHTIVSLRGNVNTRLRKLGENEWNGAIFAAAGLERIGLRPEKSIDLDWMLPAPAQGAIMVVCRDDDSESFDSVTHLDHPATALCTMVERSFLKTLQGGCSSPVSALAKVNNEIVHFRGNIASHDGVEIEEINRSVPLDQVQGLGQEAATSLLQSDKVWIKKVLKRS